MFKTEIVISEAYVIKLAPLRTLYSPRLICQLGKAHLPSWGNLYSDSLCVIMYMACGTESKSRGHYGEEAPRKLSQCFSWLTEVPKILREEMILPAGQWCGNFLCDLRRAIPYLLIPQFPHLQYEDN